MTACLLALLALGGCSSGDAEQPAAQPTPDRGTPLGRFHSKRVAVTRGEFCDRLPAAAVERALGSSPRRERTYRSGQRVKLSASVHDIVHENGCILSGPKGTVARAWVFAPPVTRDRARELAAAAARMPGCSAVGDAPAFGKPSVATVCPAAKGGGTVAAYAGLFGDAWLSCSLSSRELDRPTLLDRTGRWCVEVAKAAAR